MGQIHLQGPGGGVRENERKHSTLHHPDAHVQAGRKDAKQSWLRLAKKTFKQPIVPVASSHVKSNMNFLLVLCG